jgi:leukotriene-A4 hydrolase
MESSRKDSCSSANSGEVVVRHLDWEVAVDFASKTLRCTATLEIRTLRDGVRSLVLDCVGLVVGGVASKESGESLPHQVRQLDGELTPSLAITLPFFCANKGSELGVRISYETDPAVCGAVQWLEPAQTAGKRLPYLFTQCQAIHAREMLPCQDTPSVKSTFTARVSVPSELVALMGAERVGVEPHPSDPSHSVFSFRQTVPIPSYLTALVVGALESKCIGPRSNVWCEKEMVEKAAWEFEEVNIVSRLSLCVILLHMTLA